MGDMEGGTGVSERVVEEGMVTASEDDADGVKDIICSTSGKGYESFIVRAGGARMPKSTKTCLDIIDESGNVRTLENIYMNGRSILSFVTDKVTGQIMELLDRNSLEPDDIDLFVFHQASKMALDTLRQILKLKSEKVFTNLSEIGNTVAASIPIALRDALDQGWISKGDLVLISGFGVGLSMGAALIKF